MEHEYHADASTEAWNHAGTKKPSVKRAVTDWPEGLLGGGFVGLVAGGVLGVALTDEAKGFGGVEFGVDGGVDTLDSGTDVGGGDVEHVDEVSGGGVGGGDGRGEAGLDGEARGAQVVAGVLVRGDDTDRVDEADVLVRVAVLALEADFDGAEGEAVVVVTLDLQDDLLGADVDEGPRMTVAAHGIESGLHGAEQVSLLSGERAVDLGGVEGDVEGGGSLDGLDGVLGVDERRDGVARSLAGDLVRRLEGGDESGTALVPLAEGESRLVRHAGLEVGVVRLDARLDGGVEGRDGGDGGLDGLAGDDVIHGWRRAVEQVFEGWSIAEVCFLLVECHRALALLGLLRLEGLLVGRGEGGTLAPVEAHVLGRLDADDDADHVAHGLATILEGRGGDVLLGGVAAGVGVDFETARHGAVDLAAFGVTEDELQGGAVVVHDLLEREDGASEGDAAFEHRLVSESGLSGFLLLRPAEFAAGELTALGQASEEHGTLFVGSLVVVLAEADGDAFEERHALEDDVTHDGLLSGVLDVERLEFTSDGVGPVGLIEHGGQDGVVEFGVGLLEFDKGGVTAVTSGDGGGTVTELRPAEVVVGQAETLVGADVTDGDVLVRRLVEGDAEVASVGAAVLALARSGAVTEVAFAQVVERLNFGVARLTCTLVAFADGVLVRGRDILRLTSVDVVDDDVVFGFELGRIMDGAHGWLEEGSRTWVPP